MENIVPEIIPSALYSVAFFARQVADIHPVTVYQSLAGIKKYPLPSALKIGRSVKFSGEAILAWRAALPAYGAAAMVLKQKETKGNKPLGAPTKAKRIADREARAAAVQLTRGEA